MSDRFDLDSIKDFLKSSSGESNKPEYSLDDIMVDFGKEKSSVNDIVDDVLSSNTTVVETSNQEIVENDVVKKPEGYSLTGAFEAIRSEKKETVALSDVSIRQALSDEKEDVPKEELVIGKEIVADIEQKRFFDTETFNSIKDKSSSDVKNTIVSFASGDMDEEDDGEEAFFKTHEPTEEIDDFENPEDREDVLIELKKMNTSASLVLTFTFILTVISGVLFAVCQSWIKFLSIDFASEYKLYIAIFSGISIVATVININTIKNGIKSILKLNLSTESFLVLIFISDMLLNVLYLTSSSGALFAVVLFDFIYMLLLLMNIYSKKLIAKTVYKNFIIASADGTKTVVNMPSSEEAVNDIMLETGCTDDIVYASKTQFVSDFISKSFKDFESSESVLNTVLAFVIIAMSVVNFFIKGNLYNALIYAIAAFCVTVPAVYAMSFAISLFTNSNKTRRQGGVIVGTGSAKKLKDVQTFIVDDADVFNTSLNGIRLYGDSLIDDAILYLNSLYSVVGGPLKKLFHDMLSDDILSLPRIDEIYYHDTMGYSGLIHSKVFIVGNKKLMDHFGVEVDDSEYEIIYQQKSKHVLFVAYDGKLMGVFLLSYSLSSGVSKAFRVCEKNQIAVCIAERDAGVNEKTLFNVYQPKEKVLFNIISFRTARKCFDKFELSNKMPSLLISNTGIKGLATSLHCCKTMSFAHKTNNIISTMASIIAVPLVTFLLLLSEPSSVLSAQVLLYHALWAVPALFVSLFSK